MPIIKEWFTYEEYEKILEIKVDSGLTWHDFIIKASKEFEKGMLK
jgi:hypothetical protein